MAIDKQSRLNLIKAGYWITIIYMVFLGLALILEGNFIEDLNALGMFTLILLGFYYWAYMGLGKEFRDERLAKAACKAMTLSWFSVVLFIGVLVMLGGRLPELDTGQMAGAVLIIMAITSSVSNECYKRSDDSKELSG